MPTRPALASPRISSVGQGAPVVLLHCLGVDRHLWDATVERLQGRFRCLTYDFPGHGETPVPAGAYTIEDLSAQLGEVLASQRIERAHVIGISLGGLVAQHFAAARPERVQRLVLADTTPRYTGEMREMWATRAAAARGAGPGSMTEGILKIWFTAAFAANNPPAVRYVRECFARTSGEGYALACEALAAADLRPLAPRIEAPALVLCGDQEVPAFLEASQWLTAHIPGARHEKIAPAKHASVLEQPEAFLRRVTEFLG